jgi:hypothetical protein
MQGAANDDGGDGQGSSDHALHQARITAAPAVASRMAALTVMLINWWFLRC